MNQEIRRHSLPLILIFVITSIFWYFQKVDFIEYFYLLIGFIAGSFFLDIDHLIYWLYINPNIEESRLAQIAFKKYDFNSLIKLLESTHQKHTNLIFHHYFFQVILALVSIFIFTSSNSILGMAFLLALNIHLIVDEIVDYQQNQDHLQNWLFARESKQLPVRYLSRYIGLFVTITLVFVLLLIRSKS